MNRNALSGRLDFWHFPDSLRELDLSNNRFDQQMVVHGELPPFLKYIYVRNCGVSGVSPGLNQYRKSAKNVVISVR